MSALGDVACSLGAAGALKKSHPDCEIVWLCDRRFADLPRACQHVDQTVELARDWREWQRQIQNLGEFDAALDLQGLLKSALPVAFARTRKRLGYHWQREGSWLFSSAVQPRQGSIHVVDQYIDVTLPLGGDPGRADFGLAPTESSLESVRHKLAGHAVSGAPIVINCGAGWSTKRWPAESFARLADAIQAHAPIVFIGAPNEREGVIVVQELMQRPSVSMAGETSIAELIALLSLARLHIAGDTGSTHIAAALGIPCVGIYTLTRPERSAPYGQAAHVVHSSVEEAIQIAQNLLI